MVDIVPEFNIYHFNDIWVILQNNESWEWEELTLQSRDANNLKNCVIVKSLMIIHRWWIQMIQQNPRLNVGR